MPKSSTTGGKFSSESQTRGSTQREQAIASAQESEDGRARQELGQHGMGSKNPDREKNSDEFDAHVGQDNKPNNKDQFTKPEARH